MQVELVKTLQKEAGGASVCVGADAEGNPLPVARLWASVAAAGTEPKWYGQGEAYWAGARADDHGVLGGQTHVNLADSLHSLRFLHALQARPAPAGARAREVDISTFGKLLVGSGRAIDCGAGVGRATDLVLQHCFKELELLEQEPRMLEAARERLSRSGLCPPTLPIGRSPTASAAGDVVSASVESDARHRDGSGPAPSGGSGTDSATRVTALHCSGLQGFRFPAGVAYDCVWLQWVIGCVTDVDFIDFLRNAAASLALPTRLRKMRSAGCSCSSASHDGVSCSCSTTGADAAGKAALLATGSAASGGDAGDAGVGAAGDAVDAGVGAAGDAVDAGVGAAGDASDAAIGDRAAGGGVIVIKDNVLLIRAAREAELRAHGKLPGPYSGCVASADAAAVLRAPAAASGAGSGDGAGDATPAAALSGTAPLTSAPAPAVSGSGASPADAGKLDEHGLLRWNSLSLPHFFRYDGEDHSITRSEPYLHQLLRRAGLVIVAESEQRDWDPELYPVVAYALRPAAWYRE